MKQQIATGFNRNHRINEEAGAIPEEFLIEYVADRVETTATVWLGLTMDCARCHNHKYDPITQRDYYRFFAFFNNVPESGVASGNAAPLVKVPSAEQKEQLDNLAAQIKKLDAELKGVANDRLTALRKDYTALDARIPTAMVMKESPQPRRTFILKRGQYNQPDLPVTAGVPSGCSSGPRSCRAIVSAWPSGWSTRCTR